jgi:hypothetical protein
VGMEMDIEEVLNEVHKELESLNNEIHSDNPPTISHGEKIVRRLKNNWGYIEFYIKGDRNEIVDWTSTLRNGFSSKVFIPELNPVPARLEFHTPYGLHINVNDEHISHDQYDYEPYASTAASFAVAIQPDGRIMKNI